MFTTARSINNTPVAARETDFRRDLRHGKRVVVVDDNADALRFAGSILESGSFAAPLLMSDPQQALNDLPDLISAGRADLLVLDMLMPGLNGPELLCQLANRNAYLPTVILSGAQGGRESRSLLGAAAAAANLTEVQTLSARNTFKRQGLALTYVAKEDAAIAPELLLAACDVMLTAKKQTQPTQELLRKATTLPIPLRSIPRAERELCAADLADLCLCWYRYHQNFVARIQAVAPLLPDNPEISGCIDLISGVFCFAHQMSYESILQAVSSDAWTHFRHGVLGSRGMQGAYGNVHHLCRLCKDPAIDKLGQVYLAEANDFVQRFQMLEDRLFIDPLSKEQVDLRDLALTAATELKLPISLADKRPTAIHCEAEPKKKLLIALREVLIDAARASATKPESKPVSLDTGYQTLTEAPASVRSHFAKLGATEETQLAYILIQHAGAPFPAHVLRNFARRRQIQRQDGSTSLGLNFTRRLVEAVNGGHMEIESLRPGAKVSLWFSTQPIGNSK